MDYFFQEQRWTDTFLSLHVKKFKRIILFLLIAFSAVGTKAAGVPTSWKDVAFNENIRYSQWVINSRIRDFYGNTTQRGFNTYDENGNKLLDSKGTQAFDYVPGLVAKAILEAYANYSTFDWSKPWFYSVMNYAKEKTYKLVTTSEATVFSGITLDNMNACKMYFPLMKDDALSTNAKSTGETAIANVLTDMKKYNELYVIGNGSESGVKNSTNATVKSMFGGWFHKPSYKDQMWCDGLYMGAALLAQIVNYTKITTNVDKTSDWNLITKQFTISWNQLYNSEKGLLYHAFTANPKDAASSAWAGISNTEGSEVYHSEAFWGRAMGWYFLALVDVLEQMPSNNSNRATLIDYLQKLAEGLAKYQDATTGCWYQVVDQKDKALSGNYLESSCTSLFAAAYLKAVRLGFLTTNGTYNYKTIGVNAFKGAVNQFMKYDTFEPTGTTVQLIHNCASAGLGGDKKRSGSREYYITGNDVGQTNTYTEGKVMGAFIMAATEYEIANEKAIRFSYDLAPSYTLAQGDFIKAEALGSGAGTATYQWYKTTDGTTGTAVTGATTATFSPTESGSYYCEAKSGSTTIKTSKTAVTVEAASNENGGSGTEDVVIATFEKATATTWNANEKNGFSISGVGLKSGTNYVKMENSTTLTMTIPSGYTVTGLKINALCKSDNTNSVLSFNNGETNVGTVTINYGSKLGDYNCTFSNNVIGQATITIKNGTKEVNINTIEVLGYQGTPSSLSITTQPVGATYDYGVSEGNVTDLRVTASIVNGTTSDYTFKYQWYSNGIESTTGSTPIGDATTEPSCTPTVTQIGTKYYYCVVTATKESEKLTATSDFAKVTVNGPTVTFTTQPQGAVYTRSDSENAAALTVVATANFSGTVSYQWYSNTTGKIPETDADKAKEKISNATSADYIPSIKTVGKTYYYCIASSTYNSNAYTAVSDLVCVDVVTTLYSYNVKGKTKPECNESRFIEDGSGNKLVKFTFGGWKYNNNKYLKPNADDTDANYITDGWSDPATQAKVNALDGYEYAISGKNDALQEDKTATKEMYGKTRYGWFESPTRDKNGVTTDSHPYTLPVRGAYMTFEPTQNGTLTIYLLQNGAWNSDTKNHIDIKPGEFRMHAFQITNQRGLVLAEFAPKYKITVNQKVMDGYSCSQCTTDPGEGNYDKTSKDISKWQEFWTLTQAERQAVYDNWKNGNNGSQTIIKLQDGSFLAIQKAIVKYEFHVTGNETYYVFSNFSKLGFSGATFQPDAQPTATPADGKISKLELSDVTAYNEITATPKNSNIEGTELKDYTYTIGGTEIAPVAGVYIPQFYSIKLTRTFKPKQWTTLSLPFNLTQTEVEQIFGKGTQIIVFDKAKITSARTYLTFFYHEIQNVLPGYPYLIRPTLVDADDKKMETKSNSADNTPTYTITDGNLTEFTVYNKAINPHITQHEFKSDGYTAKCTPSYCTANVNGNYSKQYKEGDIFVSEGNGTVYISEGRSYGKGYRSYIDYTGTTAPAKALSISFSGVEDGDDNGTTTEIRVTELADDVIQTLGIGGVYNLNGQKVADTTRNLPAGIYIVNGRKVVVK
jgi:rhamnogalacturonyl hydrolase YesR